MANKKEIDKVFKLLDLSKKGKRNNIMRLSLTYLEDNKESKNYFILTANLNGTRHVIDIGNEDIVVGDGNKLEYFEVIDSLILDFMGTPVYMYGYVKHKYPAGGEPYALYTRYGYFLNDTHYQSEKFYPAGVLNDAGRITNLHDVFGSEARDGKYGYGQCAGYIIKEKTSDTQKRTVPDVQQSRSML